MRILLYEFTTGGGWHSQGDDPPGGSLLAEGRAMRDALAGDFAALPDCQVDLLHDTRLDPPPQFAGVTWHRVGSSRQEQRTLAELSAAADATILIAPEFGERLLTRTRLVERGGGRLLCPSSQVVALCGDKQATVEHLARHGVAVPRGMPVAAHEELPSDFDYPAVLKPRDGAGSLGIERIAARGNGSNGPTAARLEVFYPGTPTCVALLCGPNEIVPLAPCRQDLADDFSYRGGSLPLETPLAARARRLALRAARSLPAPRGYLGIDLVLGDDPAGSGDVVVEINPRLTTSYVGLRAASQTNLAAAMLAIAAGEPWELCWKSESLTFTSAGDISRSS